jgi:uncharacterized membrane protein YidH (DUF202 family)
MRFIDNFKNEHIRLCLAWFLILMFFLISVLGLLFPQLNDISVKISHRDYNGEGFIEFIEAVFWLAAFIIIVLLFKRCKKHNYVPTEKYWYIFFVVFFFIAFGEEISWGQHLFKFETPEMLESVNRQKEFNVHNLNISQILELDESNPLYRYLQNFTSVLNPIFYLICGLLWFVIPIIKRFNHFQEFLKNMPLPNLGTIVFCGLNIVVYLVIDKLFFDMGEIFELALALTALLFSMDLFDDNEGRLAT